MRFFAPARRTDERLLWSRDIRFVNRLARTVPGARLLELHSGSCLIAPAERLTDAVAAEVARAARSPEYGLVVVDEGPDPDRYLVAFSAAVQESGIADRIGMAQSTHVAQTKVLDYFFSLKNNHGVAFQPIVELATGALHEWECLFRPNMPMLPQSITSIVQAGIDTDRSVELDAFIIGRILERLADVGVPRMPDDVPLRFALNLTPAALLADPFDPVALAAAVREAGLDTRQLTLECTEQQAVSDLVPLQRRVKELRRLGFGFAVDDAGAGYASFTMIAALRPSIIKIDREIVHGIGNKKGDAKQALVEAFVSFGRRIGARLVAEGIENRRDLAMLTALGVQYGQGFFLGRPAATPGRPRREASRAIVESPMVARGPQTTALGH